MQWAEPVMGGKFKVPGVEDRTTRFPSVHACLLIIPLYFKGYSVMINKGIDQGTKKGLLLLIIHYLDVLPT